MDAKLTKNQELVLGALKQGDGPMTAYELLDVLRGDGLRAPLQIYRALEKLTALGSVHRLESLNAFVACQHDGDHKQDAAVFAICDSCGQVSEYSDANLSGHVSERARADGFQLTKTTIELRGACQGCTVD